MTIVVIAEHDNASNKAATLNTDQKAQAVESFAERQFEQPDCIE